ncbi:MAG: hypothetical protein JO032_17190 [Alphaproteobacteria bacterium]|nr:hypothetical protein [Alphaproteobacteria bacterium]
MGQDVRRGARRLSARPAPPVIVVHSLAHALAALEAAAEIGCCITLLSAPDAGVYAGAGWFKALIEAARQAVPLARFDAILDCGDRAGAVQGAIRTGIGTVVFNGRADVAERLAEIAQQAGGALLTTRPRSLLDLGELFFASPDALRARCGDALASV